MHFDLQLRYESKKGEDIIGMKVCYNKLWKQLIDKNMKKKDLRELASISSSSIAKLGHNDFVSLEVLVKICEVLQCDIGDIMEVIPNEQK